MLREVFPSEVPVEMIDNILIEFGDGTQAKMDHSELKHPLPTAPNKTWAALIQAYTNVKQITIVVDVNKVESTVGGEVSNILDKHFK